MATRIQVELSPGTWWTVTNLSDDGLVTLGHDEGGINTLPFKDFARAVGTDVGDAVLRHFAPDLGAERGYVRLEAVLDVIRLNPTVFYANVPVDTRLTFLKDKLAPKHHYRVDYELHHPGGGVHGTHVTVESWSPERAIKVAETYQRRIDSEAGRAYRGHFARATARQVERTEGPVAKL